VEHAQDFDGVASHAIGDDVAGLWHDQFARSRHASRPTEAWLIPLGPAAIADLLAEMIAALVYHYEPDPVGGSAITDVCINDGDFVAKRRSDGSFDVRLTAVRRRENGVSPSLLLLYLIQMMAYEDWTIDGRLVANPNAEPSRRRRAT